MPTESKLNRTPIQVAVALALPGIVIGCSTEHGSRPGEQSIGRQTAALAGCVEFTSSVMQHEGAGRAYSVQESCEDGGSTGPQQLLFDDFSSLANWTESGEGDWNTEGLHSSSGYTGSGAPAAHVDNCDSECTIALSTGIDLTAHGSAQLTFLRFVDEGFDWSDYLRVELYDGSSWNLAFEWSGGDGDTDTWHQETVDLASYLGVSDFRVRFVARASYSTEHAQIDDLEITAGGGQTTCPAWYAAGTDQPLGTNPAATVTLYSETDGIWSIGRCPGQPPACGDGVVDPGELCDGNCPASCDDQDACTLDILAGAALSCDARCVHSPMMMCQHGDGCCPSACDPSNDNDCSGGGDVCPAFTDTVDDHEDAGRAYSEFAWWPWPPTTRYYATGSDEHLGTSGAATVTLYENAAGVFSLTQGPDCGCGCDGRTCGADNGCGIE